MRRKNAVKNYVSGIGKLSARDNPFADEDIVSAVTEKEIKPKAYVRPRNGAYIAAAVLTVCVSVGAVFASGYFNEYDTPADSKSVFSAVPDDSSQTVAITDTEGAIKAYRDADRESFNLLKSYDKELLSNNDADTMSNISSRTYEKLNSLTQKRNEALSYINSYSMAAYCLLDIIKYEGEDNLSLSFVNITGRSIVLSGKASAYENNTGKKLCDISLPQITLPPNEVSYITLPYEGIGTDDFNVKLETQDGVSVSLKVNPEDIIPALSRQRISELTQQLSKK